MEDNHMQGEDISQKVDDFSLSQKVGLICR